MKAILKLEELAMLAVSIYGLYVLKVEWWYYLLLAFGPDISMIAYAAGNKAGAIVYNLLHHKGVSVTLFLVGMLISNTILQITGLIIFGHASMDRIFGYGLKLPEGFKYTHLGIIGKNEI